MYLQSSSPSSADCRAHLQQTALPGSARSCHACLCIWSASQSVSQSVSHTGCSPASDWSESSLTYPCFSSAGRKDSTRQMKSSSSLRRSISSARLGAPPSTCEHRYRSASAANHANARYLHLQTVSETLGHSIFLANLKKCWTNFQPNQGQGQGKEFLGARRLASQGTYRVSQIIRTYDFTRISSLWCNRRSSSFQTFLKYISRVIDECCIVPRSCRGLVPSPVRLALG